MPLDQRRGRGGSPASGAPGGGSTRPRTLVTSAAGKLVDLASRALGGEGGGPAHTIFAARTPHTRL
jgi:hypothetical protein